MWQSPGYWCLSLSEAHALWYLDSLVWFGLVWSLVRLLSGVARLVELVRACGWSIIGGLLLLSGHTKVRARGHISVAITYATLS